MPNIPIHLQEQRYRNLLDEVEARLDEAAKDPYGPNRGHRRIRALMRAEATSGVKRRRVTLDTAETELNSLIYQRHALRHGYFRITEMNKKELAQSLLDSEDAAAVGNIEIQVYQARIILKELWRYGRSPLLEDFRKKVQERLDGEQRMRANYCRKHAIQVMKDFHRKWRQWEGERQFNSAQQRHGDETDAAESQWKKAIGDGDHGRVVQPF